MGWTGMKIGVVGLGNVGLPLASVMADSGFEVIGVDIDEERCEKINKGINPIPEEAGLDDLIERYGGNRLLATPRYEDARGCKGFIVIVPLFIDEGHNPDFNILEEAFRSVGKILKKGDLVVLETTVPPTTTETRIRSWLEEESGLQLGDFYLAHSPERIMTGYSISRLREFPKIVGGVNEESGRRSFDLYRKFIPNLKMVSSSRVAEFVKIIEGSYRDVNIALANELFKIAEEMEIDFHEAREYANHDYCHIHLPSTGVGGHCIPVYPWFLINEMEKREMLGFAEIQRTSRKINDEMVGYWVERIVLKALDIDKPLGRVKICLKGITYRDGVKGIYHSRNLALARLLARKGLQVGVYDELFTQGEIDGLSLRFMNPDDADLVFDCFELRFSA